MRFFWLFLFCGSVVQASSVDEMISLALNLPTESSAGRFACRAIGSSDAAQGSGPTMELAHARYVLECIREQCGKIGGQIADKTEEILAMDEPALRAYLKALQIPAEQIEIVVQKKYQPREVRPRVTCQTATLTAREYVVTLCSYQGVTCAGH